MDKPQHIAEREPQDWIEREVIDMIRLLCETATDRKAITDPLKKLFRKMVQEYDSPLAWYYDKPTRSIRLVGIENEDIGRVALPDGWS